MEKTILCGGTEIRLKASALVPRLYRFTFGRDMMKDMNKLRRAYNKATDIPEDATEEQREDAQLSALDLTIFENVAFIMARHADPKNAPATPDEWLDSLPGVFSVYEVLPEILEMWQLSTATTAVPAKK